MFSIGRECSEISLDNNGLARELSHLDHRHAKLADGEDGVVVVVGHVLDPRGRELLILVVPACLIDCRRLGCRLSPRVRLSVLLGSSVGGMVAILAILAVLLGLLVLLVLGLLVLLMVLLLVIDSLDSGNE